MTRYVSFFRRDLWYTSSFWVLRGLRTIRQWACCFVYHHSLCFGFSEDLEDILVLGEGVILPYVYSKLIDVYATTQCFPRHLDSLLGLRGCSGRQLHSIGTYARSNSIAISSLEVPCDLNF